eukprot:TRINITY_DN5008_c0_g1_i2.p2 TRINITY_DN5008_c0_g1~~TRINITY_DN5008_c0_g1_i2.p2  ORF type:complete len:251 (-),score=-11.88 TRINITY_DN5008_c0_g1_i2:1544-2296(-)
MIHDERRRRRLASCRSDLGQAQAPLSASAAAEHPRQAGERQRGAEAEAEAVVARPADGAESGGVDLRQQHAAGLTGGNEHVAAQLHAAGGDVEDVDRDPQVADPHAGARLHRKAGRARDVAVIVAQAEDVGDVLRIVELDAALVALDPAHRRRCLRQSAHRDEQPVAHHRRRGEPRHQAVAGDVMNQARGFAPGMPDAADEQHGRMPLLVAALVEVSRNGIMRGTDRSVEHRSGLVGLRCAVGGGGADHP